jgi:hypothetical protein
VTSTGRVGRVAPVELVRLTPQQLATADVSGGAAIAVTDGRACLTAPDGGAVSLRLTKPVEANGLFMSIEYQSTTPASVLPVVTDGGALNFNWSPATLAAGRDARVVRVRHDLADGVALVFPDGVDNLCLDGLALLEVALLEPVPVAGAPSGVRCPVLDGSGHITQTLVRCDGRWR